MQIVYNGTDIGTIQLTDLDNLVIVYPGATPLISIEFTDRCNQNTSISYGNTYDFQDTDEAVKSYINGQIRSLMMTGNIVVTIPPLSSFYDPTTPSDWQVVAPITISEGLDQAAQIASSYRNGTATLLKLLDGSNIGDVTHHIGTAHVNTLNSLSQSIFKVAGNNKLILDPTLTSILTNTVVTGTISATNLSGTNTGDQTITLTGGVTGSGTGTFSATVITNANLTGDITSVGNATTIGANKVTLSNMATIPTNSLLGRYTVGTGNVQNITVGTGLSFTGNVLNAIGGSGTVTAVSVTTANGISGTVANSTSTPAITLTLGAITPISVAATGTVTGSNLSGINTGNQTITLTGDVTGTGTGSFAATISNDSVSFAKMTNVNSQTILGRSSAGSGNIETLAVGAGLTLSGGILSAAGGSGTVTTVSIISANGISGVVATPTTTPSITLTLGVITPTSVVATGAISGSNLSGTNTGDQTITLTGGVTGSGTGSFAATVITNANMTGDVTSIGNATTIGSNKVTLSMMAQMATNSLLGRSSASTGNVEVISVGSGLTLSGGILTASGSSTVTLTGDVTGSGSGSFATTISANAVTLSKIVQIATNSLLGRSTAGTGNTEVISVGSGLTLSGGILSTSGSSGTVTSVSFVSANGISGSVSNATTTPAITLSLDNSSVTFAKMNSVLTNKILGRSSTGIGDIESLAVGSGLLLSGGTLSATGQTMASGFLLGRTTAGPGAPEQITVGTGLTFAAGNLSVTAGAGGLYDSGSFVLTLTGFSGVAPTGTAHYARAGNIVTIYFPSTWANSFTSNASSMHATGLPSSLLPTTDNMIMTGIPIVNNGVNTIGSLFLPKLSFGSDIIFSITPMWESAGENAFAASGTKSAPRSFCITYILF